MTNMIAQQDALAVTALPEVKKKFKIQDLINTPNIATKLSKDERGAFGAWVLNGYQRDLATRIEWDQRNAEVIKMALQVKEVKSFPWTNCSNVKFPLIAIAALQFLARISILTKGRKLAKFEPIGKDPDGKKGQQARRISEHVSMQLIDDDISWLDMDEQAKFSAALLGSAFKKSYFDPVKGTNVSEFVPAQNFVFDYYCKHIDTTLRATHMIPMDANKVIERIRRGLFIEEDVATPPSGEPTTANLLQRVADEAQGTRRQGGGEEYRVLEQHCWFDFDGDGYAEPYIISVREDTGHLYRIVARYFDDGDVHRVNDLQVMQADNLARETDDMKVKSQYEKQAKRLSEAPDNHIVRIDPVRHFTKYTFIPSPDGGSLGIGFGVLLGPISSTIDTLINQLNDSGTMSTTAGGFLGRGVKLKGGKTSFDPFEWKPVDSSGDDLRKNIFPLPVRDPSPVLFQLLGVLISYGEKLASATDIMTGVSPGQNTPAETSRNTVEQGMMLFSGIYSRMYRAFREELSKLYELNRLYLHTSPKYFDLTQGADAILSPSDYTTNRFRIFPVADPSAVSGQQRKDKADKLVAFAGSPLGVMLNKAEVTRRWLEANEYDDMESVFPDPTGPNAVKPPPNPKVELEKQKLQQAQQEHSDNMMLEVGKMKQDILLNEAKISELQAKATMELAKADGVDKGHQLALLDAQIGAAKSQNELLLKSADLLVKAHTAKAGIEQGIHGMTMDVHDRQSAKDSAAKQQTAGDSNDGD